MESLLKMFSLLRNSKKKRTLIKKIKCIGLTCLVYTRYVELHSDCGCETDMFDTHRENRYDFSSFLYNTVYSSDNYETEEYTKGFEVVSLKWKDSKLFVILATVLNNSVCDKCYEEISERIEHAPSCSLLQGAIYSHGLNTGFGFSSKRSVIEKLKNIQEISNCNKFSEVCCSWKNQKIGDIGIFMSGFVSVASNKDLWSYLDADSVRKFSNATHVFEKRDQLNFRVWSHTEFFVVPQRIVGLWVRRAKASLYEEEIAFAKNRNIKVFYVN